MNLKPLIVFFVSHSMEFPIKNKVAESGIITIDLEDFFPKEESVLFDIKEYLFMEMILKEKDFREKLKQANWEKYRNKNVGIICSGDAIIPLWAYMLITAYLQPIAAGVVAGNLQQLEKSLILKNIQQLNPQNYIDARVVIKGCGERSIEPYAYTEITRVLLPVVKSIMYGEPCSAVPVFKKK